MAFIGTGTTIAFETGFLAEILSVRPPNSSRGSIQTSHMATDAVHTFLPTDLVDNGETVIEIAYEPVDTVPIDQPESSCVITFGNSAATTKTFQAFMTNFEPNVPFEERSTATVTLKVTGAIS